MTNRWAPGRPITTAQGLMTRIARAIRAARMGLKWTQRDLAAHARVSQSTVSRLERAVARAFDIERLSRVLDALQIRPELWLAVPADLSGQDQRDRVHARVMAYVARRLRRLGWMIAREAPIGGARARGWIDLLAWNPLTRVLVVVEIKSSLSDLGALERQIGWYERAAWEAARSFGWRPSRVVVLVAALASEENLGFTRCNREALRARFPVAPKAFEQFLQLQTPTWSGAGRCMAFVDPGRRRRRFLLPAGVLPGPPAAPYRDARALGAFS